MSEQSVDAHEEAVLALLQPPADVARAHDDPDPVRRIARRILQRLDGMGKWGGYHTEFAHLSRGFAPDQRAMASQVGERLLQAGLLVEKTSVGQRHVNLNPRRSGDVRRLVAGGRCLRASPCRRCGDRRQPRGGRSQSVGSDRLSPLDASFLHLEDASSHMHVAAVLIFEGRPPAYDDFVSFAASRLHLVPRYRQRLAFVPLNQARPKWVDDEEFDPRFHIRATALPRPGGEYELQVLAARLFARPLNRERPLWEMWLVEGLDRGRFAVMSKTHHALVDGISGLDILSVLFSSEEESGEGDWRPQPPQADPRCWARRCWNGSPCPPSCCARHWHCCAGPGVRPSACWRRRWAWARWPGRD